VFDQPPQAHTERLFAWPELRPRTGGVGRTTWWRMIKAGLAPAPVQVSPNRVAWRESDIEAWQAARKPRSQAAA
jgi:prophage regulatory protein